MLRVTGDLHSVSHLSLDKRRKQLTLHDPNPINHHPQDHDRRPTIHAPKMFAFDGVFSNENTLVSIFVT